jgi:cytochrome c oxidase subunit II
MRTLMKKLAVLSALMLGACTTVPSVDQSVSSSSRASETVLMSSSSASSRNMAHPASSMPTVAASSAAKSSAVSSIAAAMPSSKAEAPAVVRKISITASNWQFAPDVITVKKGEKVQLIITATEGMHGFAIPGLRINESLDAGQTIVIDLPTDVSGNFEFRCSIPCGPGHRDMKGTIVIE